MKNLICAIIVCLLAVSAEAKETEPSTGFVTAFSGLKLRVSPGSQGQVLKVIPYGESVEIMEVSDVQQRIEWLEGNWIKVSYLGIEGYVFDGFVTTMVLPEDDVELSNEDSDLTYPLLAYIEKNHNLMSMPDSTVRHNTQKVGYQYDNISLNTEESRYHFKVVSEFENIKLKDAYNLMRSMLLTKQERQEFERQTLFIKNRDGVVDNIKIGIENPVQIKKSKNGNVKITVTAFYQGC